jgi:hypothetical protein
MCTNGPGMKEDQATFETFFDNAHPKHDRLFSDLVIGSMNREIIADSGFEHRSQNAKKVVFASTYYIVGIYNKSALVESFQSSGVKNAKAWADKISGYIDSNRQVLYKSEKLRLAGAVFIG